MTTKDNYYPNTYPFSLSGVFKPEVFEPVQLSILFRMLVFSQHDCSDLQVFRSCSYPEFLLLYICFLVHSDARGDFRF